MRDAVETTAIAVANKLTFGGSVGTLLGWVTSSQFGVLLGMVIGVSGLAMNWYFKSRHDKRAQASHKAYMETLHFKASMEYQGEDE